MSSSVGYQHDEPIILCIILEPNIQSSWQQRDRLHHASIAHHSKSDANAGASTSVRTMTWMGCSPYVNWFSDFESCVFERIVTLAIHENYLANYVQKLR